MRLRDRVAIITGGNRGLGRAIAEAYVREGARVALAARHRPSLEETAHALAAQGRVLAIPTDVIQENQVVALVSRVVGEWNRIDILVNNAGIAGPTAPVVDLAVGDWDEVQAINVRGVFLCAKAVLRVMIPRRAGSIINMSSLAGVHGYPLRSPYAASKWAVVGFTETLAHEVGEYNIRVNALCPGAVRGERIAQVIRARAEATGLAPEEVERAVYTSDAALRKLVEPEDVADAAVYFGSDESKSVTGQYLRICAGRRY